MVCHHKRALKEYPEERAVCQQRSRTVEDFSSVSCGVESIHDGVGIGLCDRHRRIWEESGMVIGISWMHQTQRCSASPVIRISCHVSSSAVDDEKLPIAKDDELAHGSAVQHVIVLLVPTGRSILRLGGEALAVLRRSNL